MKRFSRNPEVVSGDVGGKEAVLLDVESGKYFGLNPTATAIWELIENPKTIDELVDSLCQMFEVTSEACKSEVQELLDSLCERGIIIREKK